MTHAAVKISLVPVRRRLTSTFFAAAALAFLLPFGTVSCEGEEVRVTGVELATFGVDGAEEHGSLAARVEEHGVVALFALVVAVVGAFVAWRADRGGGFAVAGLCLLQLLAYNEDTLVLGPTIDLGVGFVLSAAAFGAAGLARFSVRVRERRRRREKVSTWLVALVLGAPAVVLVLLFVAAGGLGY